MAGEQWVMFTCEAVPSRFLVATVYQMIVKPATSLILDPFESYEFLHISVLRTFNAQRYPSGSLG